MLKGFTRKFKPLEILTEEQLRFIHRGTLDVLETTGVRVEHDRALQLFADHGCKVDFKEKRVRIPGYLKGSYLIFSSSYQLPPHK